MGGVKEKIVKSGSFSVKQSSRKDTQYAHTHLSCGCRRRKVVKLFLVSAAQERRSGIAESTERLKSEAEVPLLIGERQQVRPDTDCSSPFIATQRRVTTGLNWIFVLVPIPIGYNTIAGIGGRILAHKNSCIQVFLQEATAHKTPAIPLVRVSALKRGAR